MHEITLHTGRVVDPLMLLAEDIDIVDIAHSLALTCRFRGHCRSFYSVAQHSVLMSGLVPREHRLWALLHDAGEAYLADVVRPLKYRLFVSVTQDGHPAILSYCREEERVMELVAEVFGLPWPQPEEVGLADNRMLATEARDLFGAVKPDNCVEKPYPLQTVSIAHPAWSPEQAEQIFLARFRELSAGD